MGRGKFGREGGGSRLSVEQIFSCQISLKDRVREQARFDGSAYRRFPNVGMTIFLLCITRFVLQGGGWLRRYCKACFRKEL
jgi:hypothetical protein